MRDTLTQTKSVAFLIAITEEVGLGSRCEGGRHLDTYRMNDPAGYAIPWPDAH